MQKLNRLKEKLLLNLDSLTTEKIEHEKHCLKNYHWKKYEQKKTI